MDASRHENLEYKIKLVGGLIGLAEAFCISRETLGETIRGSFDYSDAIEERFANLALSAEIKSIETFAKSLETAGLMTGMEGFVRQATEAVGKLKRLTRSFESANDNDLLSQQQKNEVQATYELGRRTIVADLNETLATLCVQI